MLLKTHHCGSLQESHSGQTVILNGWVQRRRDLGGVIFIDLRDRSGLVQIVFNPDFSTAEGMKLADRARNEYVLAAKGKVVERDAETVNPNIQTGRIEVQVSEIEILNPAKNPPFFIEDGIEVDEAIRLRYRYLDLRRPEMQKTMRLRSKASKVFRDFLDEQGFLDVETPMLTKSTPEGARDYLVPSRVHPGEFYALPQSPQLFKQLLMVSGIERYYQITRCFRDEDLRSDRQPEFTQVDIETSFLSEEQLQNMMEELLVRLFRETVQVDVPRPFQRMSYQDALAKYGSDKPDLRFGLELVDLSADLAQCGVKVFQSIIEKGGQVKGLNAKGCASWSRKEIDDLGVYAGRFGAKGMAWITVKDGEMKGPIVKFFSETELAAVSEQLQAEDGDLLLFCADTKKVVADVLGNLRLKLGRDLKLIDESQYKFVWITDFPLLAYDEEAKRFVAEHHPFTRPHEEDEHLFDTDPSKIRGQAYDIVLNGYEVGGGSMRIYRRETQEKMFKALGFDQAEAQERFGFLLEAFEYGTPPHGGIAFGLDRLIMLLAGRTNLRETIAFPKTQNATCLLTDAPGSVDTKQLQELSLRVAAKAPKAVEATADSKS